MGQLFRLIFTSRAAMGRDDAMVGTMAAIVQTSRRNNDAAGLTSAIAIHAGQIAQVLEGGEPAVEETFARIRRDTRHAQVSVLQRGLVEGRAFPGEAMALLGRSAEGRRALERLVAGAGGALAGCDPDALLATLRKVAEGEVAASWPGGRPGDPGGRPGDPGGRPGDPDGAAAPNPGAVLADRLRAELQRPVGRDGPAATPEQEAVDAVLAIALFSAEGVAVRANRAYCALLGLEHDRLAGTAYQALISPDDADRLARLWTAMRRGETVTLHHRAVRSDRSVLWLESTFRPRLDGGGRLLDVVEIATDHTDRQLQRADDRGQIQAINTTQAVAHFNLDGTVIDANPIFLAAVGYELDEIRGQHHRIFVPEDHARGGDYAAFWAALSAGLHRDGEFRYVGRNGRPVWMQASYNPICDMGGQPFKVVAYATVVTDAKLRQSDSQWQVAAIYKSHAVISFDLNGIVLDANDLFLTAVGYDLDEIVGRHHRMFVEPSHAHGAEYATFWRNLSQGRHQAGEYKRFGRGGREVWLQATYNPVFDMDGRPFKVVKYATVVTEERLRQAEHQGQIAAIHKAQCVISFDLDGTILDANDNFLDAVGYRLGDVRGRHHRMFVDPAEAEAAAYAAFWAELAAGKHKTGEFRRIARDGREIWLQATYNPILDMNGRPFRVVKYATDITGEKLQRADFEGQIAAIRKSQGVVTFALDGTITDMNDAMLEILGYGIDEVQGRHHAMLVEPGQRDTADYAAFWQRLREGTFASGLYKRLGKGGRDVWIQASYNPILDVSGRPFKIIKFASDVTAEVALAEAYEDAKQQAQHDSATALPNRMRLASFMASALAEPDARLAVFYVDIDRFKAINDAHGHATGDRVLGEVADRLRRALAAEQLVARVGGDEFVVAAPNLEDEHIEAICHRLLACTKAPMRHEGLDIGVTLSIGVAVSPADGQTPDELLRCADAALHRSKAAGRATYTFYSATMNDRILAHRKATDDIQRAIARGEFFLEYQPRFAAHNRQMQSFEALVRWQHPEQGRIGPADFIPLAERSGLIVPLGRWVLRTACRAAARWGAIGVSVNVSPIQFRHEDLAALVKQILDEEGLPPARLELEITEGVLLENVERARKTLDDLKALGIKLAMDDFGTGYSSLSTLRSYPFDVIKIDKQFIADMDDRQGGRAVVQAILGLGRALGLSVTAEGVETMQQLDALAHDDCDEVQGFLLGRPMAEQDVLALTRPDGAQGRARWRPDRTA